MVHSSPIRRKILFVCHDGDLFGSQQSLLLLLKSLPKRKYQCHVSIAKPGPLNDLLAKELPHVIVTSHQRVQWVKHDKRSLLQAIGDVFSVTLGAVPRVLLLAKYIHDNQVDLVHTNSLVSLEGALAAKQAGVPHVWHIRELFMLPNPKLHTVLNRPTVRQYIDMMSQRVFCISQAVQTQFKELSSFWESRYPVIYNALSDNALKEPLPETLSFPKNSGFFTVGYMGRLSEGKRFHDLVECLAGIKEVQPDLSFKLLVAGKFVDTAYEKAIQDLIAEAGLRDNIIFQGYQTDVASFFRKIDVLVIPSQHEPFGRVVIEAMNYGAPCIGTDSGGITEIINDPAVGYTYSVGDKKTLAEILITLMQDSSVLLPMVKAAKAMVQKRFSIEQQSRLIQHHYDAILSGTLSS